MAKLHIAGIQATAALKWFKLKPWKDGLTLFDLLGLQEDHNVSASVEKSLAARTARLRQVQQVAQKNSRSDYLEIARQLTATLQGGARTLHDPAQCAAYRAELAEARGEMFARVVESVLGAGRSPSEPELAQLLQEAQQYRLAEEQAKKIINDLAGVGQGENKYATFGILRVNGDPAWPTYFDLLLLDESVTSENVVRSQAIAQTRRADEAEAKHTEMDRKRLAVEYREKVAQASNALLSKETRASYLRQITEHRRKEFSQKAQIARGADSKTIADVVIRLLSEAARMRLAEDAARAVITEVTGFADYMSLLGERKTPLLGRISTLRFEVSTAANVRACEQTLVVRNQGAGALTGSASSTCDWLTVEPVAFKTTAIQRFAVRIDGWSLPSGVETAGHIKIETNGGSQIVSVEAVVGGGEVPSSTRECLIACGVYLLSLVTTFLGPMICVLVFEKKSRYLTMQAAQATVLGVVALNLMVFGGLLGIVCLGWIPLIGLMVIYGTALVCAILALLGKAVKVPVVCEYAMKFIS